MSKRFRRAFRDKLCSRDNYCCVTPNEVGEARCSIKAPQYRNYAANISNRPFSVKRQQANDASSSVSLLSYFLDISTELEKIFKNSINERNVIVTEVDLVCYLNNIPLVGLFNQQLVFHS